MSPRRPKDNDNAKLELYQKLEEFDPELARKFRQLLGPDGLLHNKYSVTCLLDKGGFGLIFKAKDVTLKRPVAIKLLHNVGVNKEKQRRQFICEATILANLKHPALPVVLEYFCEGDLQFLVMTLIEGEDLGKLLKRKVSFTIQQVLRYADALLDAVDHLHSQNEPIIHRDIKPSNVILTKEDKVVLLDFGLAKGEPDSMLLMTENRKRTLSLLAFTASYAPLEQLNGSGTDVQSDIFALGATIYHMATGQVPCKTAAERWREFHKSGRDPLPLAHELNPAVPPELSRVLERAMAISPGERFASVAEMRAEVAKVRAKVFGASHEMEDLLRQLENNGHPNGEKSGGASAGNSKDSQPSTKIKGKDSPERPQTNEEDKLRTRVVTNEPVEEAPQPVPEPEDEIMEEEGTVVRVEAETPQPAPQAPVETPVASIAEHRRKSKRLGLILRAIAAMLVLAFGSAVFFVLWFTERDRPATGNRQANASVNRPLADSGNDSGNVVAGASNGSNISASSNTRPNTNVAPHVVNSPPANTHVANNNQRVPAPPVKTETVKPPTGEHTTKAPPHGGPPPPHQNAPRSGQYGSHRIFPLPRNQAELLSKLAPPPTKRLEKRNRQNRIIAMRHIRNGLKHERRGDFEKAAEEYLAAVRSDKKFIEARIHLANMKARLGFYGEALDKYEEVGSLCEETIPCRQDSVEVNKFNWAVVSVAMKKEAERKYQDALRNKPKRPATKKDIAAYQKDIAAYQKDINRYHEAAKKQLADLKKFKSDLASNLQDIVWPGERGRPQRGSLAGAPNKRGARGSKDGRSMKPASAVR